LDADARAALFVRGRLVPRAVALEALFFRAEVLREPADFAPDLRLADFDRGLPRADLLVVAMGVLQ
jgi:hypothetical protein